jgi:RND family efflux transporter MFP subunit
VERLYVDYVGQSVGEGEKLLELYSPQLVAAQEELLTAIDYRENVSGSSNADVVKSGGMLLENSKRKLELWDISAEQIDELIRTKQVRRTLTIFAPSHGVVLRKNVIQGQHIKAGQMLLTIADLSTVWLHGDLYEYELTLAEIGQPAIMRLPYVPGEEYEGRVSFIHPTLDPKARTGRVRIDFPNHEMKLKPEMFANVEIETQPRESVIAVPEQAVIRTGTKDVIIVSLGSGRFEPREITLGIYSGGYFEVMNNLEAGENVVVSSQFLIDSESNLRAALNALRSKRDGNPGGQQDTGESDTPAQSTTHQH